MFSFVRGIELPSPVCTAPTGTRWICGAPGTAAAMSPPPPAAAAFTAAADFDAAAAEADCAGVLGLTEGFGVAEVFGVAEGVNVGFGVAEALAVFVGVGVGVGTGAAHVGRMIVSWISVTAPVPDACSPASSRPMTVTPLPREMLSCAMTVPSSVEPAPRVAALPIFQKMLHACAPRMRLMLPVPPVINVLAV